MDQLKVQKVNFRGLLGISSIIEENRDIIESEIINAQNNKRAQEPTNQENSSTEKTPIEKYTESAKQAIAENKNIPDYQKQRAYDIMDLLAEMPVSRIFSERGNNYSTAITLQENRMGFGYKINTKYFDEYSGTTMGRDSTPISAVSLAKYINEHRIELDKEVKKIRASLPEKKSSQKYVPDNHDDR